MINWQNITEKDFDLTPTKDSADKIKEKTKKLLINAVKSLAPKTKFGILFSGGVDSTLIALICKNLGLKPTLYTSALDEPGMETAKDLIYAKKAAKELGLKFKVNKLRLKDVEKRIKIIASIIKDNTVVKMGVGLTIYAGLELAKKDGMKIVLGGIGSEEIFAGYERHKLSSGINKECVAGLTKLYERDLSRDIPIAESFGIKLEAPFLEEKLVRYALTIPAKYKVSKTESKIIVRDIAEEIGLSKELARRKKQAAQYGSKLAKAIEKLAKKAKAESKAEYLAQFYTKPRNKIAALVSSGKDSMFATYLMKTKNYDIKCFVSLKSKNTASYMFHTPAIDLVKLQAKTAGFPLIYESTEGKKEDELKDLKNALKKAKDKYQVDGIVTGALFSQYQKERIEKVCEELKLEMFSPLWHMDQELEMRHLLKNNFKFIFTAIAAEGFNKKWLNKVITSADIEKLKELNKRYNINIAGEGGEFESLTLDCPLFKQEIEIVDSEIEEEQENCAKLIIKKAILVDK